MRIAKKRSGFGLEVKTIEGKNGTDVFFRAQDPTVTLNSLIISNTRLREVSWWAGGMTKQQFEERHVLFQNDDKATYINQMLAMIHHSDAKKD